MCEFESVDANDALREARDCCERIASVLDESSSEAEQLGDREMLDRLKAAKAAARRAQELIDKLAGVLDYEAASKVRQSSS
jgi:hypothetical protein